MKAIQNPITASITFSAAVGGRSLDFFQRWNDTTGSWALSITDSTGVSFGKGVRCIPFVPLVRRKTHLLEGNLYIVSDTPSPTEGIGRHNFGPDKLYYLTHASDLEVTEVNNGRL